MRGQGGADPEPARCPCWGAEGEGRGARGREGQASQLGWSYQKGVRGSLTLRAESRKAASVAPCILHEDRLLQAA